MDCDLNGFESSEAGTVPEADNFTQWDFPRDLQILAKYFDTLTVFKTRRFLYENDNDNVKTCYKQETVKI